MKPTRRTQPFRQGAREPGQALDAATRGRTAQGWNPQDAMRGGQGSTPAVSGDGRPARPQRPKRRDRPPRPQR